MARPGSNRRTGIALFAVVPVMVALSFAAVPFYSWFCRVTGFAGTTSVAEGPSAREEPGRLVTVSFDANVAPGMPWQFRPKQRSMTLRLGETGLAFFEAYNPTDRADGRAGRLQRRAVLGGRLFRQDRLLLLRPAGARTATSGWRCRCRFFVDPGDARRPRGTRRRPASRSPIPCTRPTSPRRTAGAAARRPGTTPGSPRRRPDAARRSSNRGTRDGRAQEPRLPHPAAERLALRRRGRRRSSCWAERCCGSTTTGRGSR